jgi:hypothetical protein
MSPESTAAALAALTTHHTGEAEFEIDGDGNPLHVQTVFVYPLKGESPESFLARGKADGLWQPGDHVKVPRQGQRFELIRIIRMAKP